MYVYYNANPSGKATGDCVIRAISFITGKSWEQVYMELAIEGLAHHDMMDTNSIWDEYLRKEGFEFEPIELCDRDRCPTIRDFVNYFQNGEYLLGTGRHLVAVRDGCYFDAWDSGNEVPVYIWTKRRNDAY